MVVLSVMVGATTAEMAGVVTFLLKAVLADVKAVAKEVVVIPFALDFATTALAGLTLAVNVTATLARRAAAAVDATEQPDT